MSKNAIKDLEEVKESFESFSRTCRSWSKVYMQSAEKAESSGNEKEAMRALILSEEYNRFAHKLDYLIKTAIEQKITLRKATEDYD